MGADPGFSVRFGRQLAEHRAKGTLDLAEVLTGEAVLRPAGDGRWTVESVCTALTACANAAWKAGDNAIPADGLVLSFSPGGTPDVRVWMRDNLRAGDVIRVGPVISRTAQTTVDAVDPTAENNPAGYDQANRTCFPGCRGAE
jgi:hypothetical protein